MDFNKRVEQREKVKGTSTVAVMHGDKLLMGKRRDNDKWTFPGGGLNDGEDPKVGALRELYEEAGITASDLDHLTSKVVSGRTGHQIEVHAYKLNVKEPPTTNSFNDPDNEVEKWVWVDTSKGLGPEVLNHLQTPRNLLLAELGLLPAEAKGIDKAVESKL